MRPAKPTFPAPDHDHGRCTADALQHAERVCERRAQKLTPIRRQVLEALLSSHRPLGAYEVIEELAKKMPRPAPITVYRALDFLMENGLVHRIESRNAFLACAHDHDETAMVAFLICERCGLVGEIPVAPVAQSLHTSARATGFTPRMSIVEITGVCAHCQNLLVRGSMTSGKLPRSPAERSLSPQAVALMLMLCLSWGFNQIAVKLALPDIPPLLQGTIRSLLALPVLLLSARLRGVKMFNSDGTLYPGLFSGLLFGIEFVLIYRGLLLTSASRAVVFLYTAPFFVALGSYRFLGERLRASQWAGLGLSFIGVALAIGVPQPNVDANILWGDLMIVGGGALWAATTLMVRATSLLHAPPDKALAYQVSLSIPILGLAAFFSGETLTRVPGVLASSLMVYQAVWVVGLTFLLWFSLVKTYSASKLSAFTFITPLFGVVASYVILHDTLTPIFGAAALLVIAGLYLVNRPYPARC